MRSAVRDRCPRLRRRCGTAGPALPNVSENTSIWFCRASTTYIRLCLVVDEHAAQVTREPAVDVWPAGGADRAEPGTPSGGEHLHAPVDRVGEVDLAVVGDVDPVELAGLLVGEVQVPHRHLRPTTGRELDQARRVGGGVPEVAVEDVDVALVVDGRARQCRSGCRSRGRRRRPAGGCRRRRSAPSVSGFGLPTKMSPLRGSTRPRPAPTRGHPWRPTAGAASCRRSSRRCTAGPGS